MQRHCLQACKFLHTNINFSTLIEHSVKGCSQETVNWKSNSRVWNRGWKIFRYLYLHWALLTIRVVYNMHASLNMLLAEKGVNYTSVICKVLVCMW